MDGRTGREPRRMTFAVAARGRRRWLPPRHAVPRGMSRAVGRTTDGKKRRPVRGRPAWMRGAWNPRGRRSAPAWRTFRTAAIGRGDSWIVGRPRDRCGRGAGGGIVARRERPLRADRRVGHLDRDRRCGGCPSAGRSVAGPLERHGVGEHTSSPGAFTETGAGVRRPPRGGDGMPLEPVAAGSLRPVSRQQRDRARRREGRQPCRRSRLAEGVAVDHVRTRREEGDPRAADRGGRSAGDHGSCAGSPPARVPRARHTARSTSEATFCTLPSIITTPTPAG